MADLDRAWTQFALDAEVDHFGVGRIVAAHNALRAEVERLRAELAARIEDNKWAGNEIHRVKSEAEAKLAKVVEAAGQFHDLYHATWTTSSPRYPECDCALATVLAAAQPEEEPSRELKRMRAFGAAAQPEEESR